jgi:hypothetical protein
MISAGQNVVSKKKALTETVQYLLCGRDSSYKDKRGNKRPYVDPAKKAQCDGIVKNALEKGFEDAPPLQPGSINEYTFEQGVFVIAGSTYSNNMCGQGKGLTIREGGFVGFDAGKSFYTCTNSHVIDKNKKIPFGDQEMPFEEAIAYAARRAREASGDDDIPPPAILVEFMKAVEGLKGGFFAREAERIWREGVAKVKDVPKKLVASEPIAIQAIREVKRQMLNGINDGVKGKKELTREKPAEIDKAKDIKKDIVDPFAKLAPEKQQKVMDGIIGTYVHGVGPEKPKKAGEPAFKLIFRDIPAAGRPRHPRAAHPRDHG